MCGAMGVVSLTFLGAGQVLEELLCNVADLPNGALFILFVRITRVAGPEVDSWNTKIREAGDIRPSKLGTKFPAHRFHEVCRDRVIQPGQRTRRGVVVGQL